MRNKHIKIVRIIGLLIFSMVLLNNFAQAQTDNWDYVADSPLVDPAPLLPVEFNGTGELSFYIGNVGLNILPFVTDDRSSVTISLGFGEPLTGTDPILALGSISGVANGLGDNWFDFFNWEYLPLSNVFRGIQKDNTDLPGGSKSQVKVQYKVTENSFLLGTPQNGFLAQWQPSTYTSGINGELNDFAQRYTYVEAKDFGDAPASYGVAEHTIDLSKTAGFYKQYFYFGSVVDPEDGEQDSVDALGDDANKTGGLNVDDEDGVTFPAGMAAGLSYIVPVTYTVEDTIDTGATAWSAWIDWNRDGVFDPGTEVIAANQIVFASGSANLSVLVPADAVEGIYFARFRIGAFGLTPTGVLAQGEVEDYKIIIGEARLYGYAFWDKGDVSLIRDAGDGANSNMVVQLYSNSVYIADTLTDTNGYYNFSELIAGDYEVRFTCNTNYLVAIPIGSDPERNRAIATAETTATATYTLTSGHGLDAAGEPSDDIAYGEPVNAGFMGGSPSSSGIDLRAYQTVEGVVVEFVAYDVEEDGEIRLQLLDADGVVVWSGYVDVTAGPRFFARFLVPGLELGQAYDFRVRDEVGKSWEARGVTVESFEAEMTRASLTGVTLSFDSLPDREYEIQWAEQLGSLWQTVTNVPSQGEQTSVGVIYPEPEAPSGFFKIILK